MKSKKKNLTTTAVIKKEVHRKLRIFSAIRNQQVGELINEILTSFILENEKELNGIK